MGSCIFSVQVLYTKDTTSFSNPANEPWPQKPISVFPGTIDCNSSIILPYSFLFKKKKKSKLFKCLSTKDAILVKSLWVLKCIAIIKGRKNYRTDKNTQILSSYALRSGFFLTYKTPGNAGIQWLGNARMRTHKCTWLALFPTQLAELQEGAANCRHVQMRDREAAIQGIRGIKDPSFAGAPEEVPARLWPALMQIVACTEGCKSPRVAFSIHHTPTFSINLLRAH